MYRRGNKSKIITSLVLVLVLTLSLGFAAFSNTLRITPQATITPDSATFDIDFSSSNTGVVTNDIKPTLTGTGITAEDAEIDNSTNPTISNLSVNFTEPDQKAVYSFYAYNNGALLAYLNSVNFLNAEGKDAFITCEADDNDTNYVEAACNGIKVTIQVGSLTTDKTETNITGHSLAIKTAEPVIVTIEYEENSARADGPFTVTFGDITLIYTTLDGDLAFPEEPNEPDSYLGASPCTYSGELTQGAEYVNGQYTYRYMQEFNYGTTWRNIESEGWGVVLTDKESEDAVTSTLCSSINNKPIVSMQNMFSESNTTSIDVSSFDTSNVTNMSAMFSSMSYEYDEEFITITGLTNFDTSNVTNMSSMFSMINTSVDVSNFNTSKVTNMGHMFSGSYTSVAITGLENFDTSNVTNMSSMFTYQGVGDLSSWDTSSVTNMSAMFSNGSAGNLSGWDTSSVTDMSYMFYYGSAPNELNWDTSSVTDMSHMFAYGSVPTVLNFDVSNVTYMGWMFAGSSATTLDLSSFDTSNGPDMEGMFDGASVTTAYARNAEEAAKFNNAEVTYISGFTFIVKP